MKEREGSLELMLQELVRVHRELLHAVVLYGSAAIREHTSARSDYNLLVVLASVDPGRLRSASSAMTKWAEAGNPPPLTFSEQEWRNSADIFPMEYADVLEHHRVLHGALNVASLQVDLGHLRLQLEQESMGKLLRLRQGAMLAGTSDPARRDLLDGAFSKLLVLFRALIRLHGEKPAEGVRDVIARAASYGGFDSGPFIEMHEHRERGKGMASGASERVLDLVLTALQQFVSHVNHFKPASHSYSAVPTGVHMGEKNR